MALAQLAMRRSATCVLLALPLFATMANARRSRVLQSVEEHGFEEIHREQARTDAAAQRQAVLTFLAAFAPSLPWSVRGEDYQTGEDTLLTGTVPLKCGDKQYSGPVKGIGTGSYGVTVQLHEGSETGPKVVAKILHEWRVGKAGDNLKYECHILRLLQDWLPYSQSGRLDRFTRLATIELPNLLDWKRSLDSQIHPSAIWLI